MSIIYTIITYKLQDQEIKVSNIIFYVQKLHNTVNI